MAKTFEFRVPGGKLVVSLLVTVVPISLVAIYASTQAGRDTETAAGRNLQTIAESISAQVRERIRTKVIAAGMIAADTAVVEVVRQSNAQYGVSEEANRAQVEAKDKIWNTPQGRSLAEAMLENRASQALRRMLVMDPSFLRITVTDREGATVAATHKTLDYNQADEEYWQNISVSGRGAVSLTDVLYDDATKSYYIGVGVPVVNEANTFIGTLDTLVDVSSLFPLVYRSDLGPGGHAAVVKADASIIASSDGASLAERVQSSEYHAIQDAKTSFGGHAAGYMRRTFPEGKELLIAFADTGLRDEFRQLDWAVVASQEADTVLGESRRTQLMIMGIALLSLACVVFLVVYFLLHTQSEIEEIEEEMHKQIEA